MTVTAAPARPYKTALAADRAKLVSWSTLDAATGYANRLARKDRRPARVTDLSDPAAPRFVEVHPGGMVVDPTAGATLPAGAKAPRGRRTATGTLRRPTVKLADGTVIAAGQTIRVTGEAGRFVFVAHVTGKTGAKWVDCRRQTTNREQLDYGLRAAEIRSFRPARVRAAR